MALRSTSSVPSATATGVAVPVPTGAAIGDIVVVGIYRVVQEAITPPAGFTQKSDLPSSSATQGRLVVFWKRLTAADAGTYSFTWATSSVCEAVASCHSGRIAVGDPFLETPGFTQSGTAGTTLTVTGPTTSYHADNDVIGIATSFTSVSWTAPTGFTEQYDAAPGNLTLDTLLAQSAGAVGSVVWTLSATSSGKKGWVGALAGAAQVTRRDATSGAPASAAAFQPTLPTHVAGDRLLLVVSGKYDTATIPTINQGWTLLGSGTGGTGSAGADTGTMFMAVYAKDAASGAETAPTVTPGGTAPNTWLWTCVSLYPSSGKAFRDAIATSAAYVGFGSDTSSASPLTATVGTFTGVQPTAGDYLIAFGASPTDVGSAIATSSTIAATGLTGGVIDSTTSNYIETTLADDARMGYVDWQGFGGTESAAAVPSFVFNNTAESDGIVATIAIRQQTGGTSVAVGQAEETDTGLTVAAVKAGALVSVGQPSVTTTALAIAAILVGRVIAVGQATETDAALAASVETITPITLNVGQAEETDAALTATTHVKVVVGQATETDSALTATTTANAAVVVGQAQETDSALAASVLTVIHVGFAEETDSALAATVDNDAVAGVVIVGQATETDTALAATVHLAYTLTDTSNRDDGIDLDGTALVEWEPAVVAPPAALAGVLAYDTARALELTGIGPAGQPLITTQDAIAPRTRDRILIGGVDFTYFRDVKTPTPDYRLIKPLLWGSATLVLPQINPQYELLGDGATGTLRRIRDGAVVVVQRVSGGTIVATDYVGFIDAINTSGSTLSLSLGGHASGRASRDDVPPPVFRKRHDIKFQVLNYLRTLNLRTTRGGEIGIALYDRGGSDGLSHVSELVALAVTAAGVQYDVMPTTGRVFDMVETDRETIDATVYLDDNLATQQLDRAFSEEPNVVYATGRTQNGQVVNGMRSPGLVQGVAPDFPGLLQLDDESADVALIREQLSIHGALNYDDAADPFLFDLDLEQAVSALQFGAGILPVTGEVDEDTWKAAWNLDLGGGFSIDRTRIFPLAWRNYTHRWYFSANGSKLRRNPNWDPHRIKTAVSYGDGLTGFNRGRIIRFAESKLAPQNVSNWQGTIALSSAVIAGEHTPGDPIIAADVMPARSLRPGMNLWLPLFDGGTLFHISGVDVSNDGANVSLIVDTQARDTMAAWEAITRNRETRSNPARAWSGHTRRSSVQQDSIAEWTDICGNLAHKIALTGGQFTEIMVPAGQEGVVQSVRMQLDNPDEFAVILSQKTLGLGKLNARVPLPLTAPPPDPQRHRVVITGTPTGGTFTLSGNSNTTSALAYNIAGPALQTAVRSLGGNLADATVARGEGGAFVVTMHGSEEDIDLGTNSLTGGDSPSVSVTSSGPSAGVGTPWYEQELIAKWLESRGVLDAWGTPEQPCGYDPSLKTNALGPTAQPITGLFHEQAGLNYSAAQPGRLYLYVWTWSDNFLLPGRVLTQQLTPGV